MDFTVPDTLVLKIVEHDIDLDSPDTTVYILYDNAINKYIIRGKRNDTTFNSCVYSFECKYYNDLSDFLEFVFDKNNKFSYILYNYDNLPSTSNEITFEFLNMYDNPVYEISGYDNKKFNKNYVSNIFRMLKNIIN